MIFRCKDISIIHVLYRAIVNRDPEVLLDLPKELNTQGPLIIPTGCTSEKKYIDRTDVNFISKPQSILGIEELLMLAEATVCRLGYFKIDSKQNKRFIAATSIVSIPRSCRRSQAQLAHHCKGRVAKECSLATKLKKIVSDNFSLYL